MKLTFLSLFTLVICIGVKGQSKVKNISYRDKNGKLKTYHIGGDSAAYYRRKYKKFMALYTNSIGYKEVTRMGDSCRRYYQLLNRKK